MSIATTEQIKNAFIRFSQARTYLEREAILAELSEQDSEIAAKIRAMLASEAKADFLDQHNQDLSEYRDVENTAEHSDRSDDSLLDPAPIIEGLGSRLGPYKLKEKIGEGGMGVVYVAEQKKPIRRKVALKIIKPGMDTSQVIHRFEAERQALAMMDHPNIAKVIDAGRTDAGRPYFVMELIHGIPITEYCDREAMSVRKRLELFTTVCKAVQHAHQKGIIHRDLKPSNVMVTEIDGHPVAKVIDFGIAKATTEQLTDHSVYTNFAQLMGTPLYMSPEQAGLSGVDIDTRSDIYSLGVVLYELLSGTTPFDRQEMSLAGDDEMRRIIREVEPPRLSTRFNTLKADDISTISQRRGVVDSRRLQRIVRGELDWIVMKSLEKDRTQRYDSASDLAEDIERYLSNEPIEAKPATSMTRLAKWSRRHVALVWTLLSVSLVLAISLGISTVAISASRDNAEQQREQADTERLRAEQQREQADTERLRAEQQTQAAIEQKNVARQNQYYAEIVAGQSQVDSGNPGGLYGDLLNHLPLPEEEDLRGWGWYYLMSKCRTEERTITYPGTTPFAAWSPDGTLIGTPGRIWEAETGKCIRHFDTSNIKRYRVAWSPDGSKFAWAMADDECAFYIWDRSTDIVSRFAGHEKSVWCLAWNPDGSQIASGSNDQTIKIWDVASQTVLWTAPTVTKPTSLAWSPDGELLAVGCAFGGGTKVWNVLRRELVTERIDRKKNTASVSWHPKGNVLAVLEDEGWYLLERDDWSVKRREKISFDGGEAIAYSPDGSLIAVAHGKTVSVWSSSGETKVAEFSGHRSPVHSLSWHPDGRRLVSGDELREVKLWNLDRRESPALSSGIAIESINWFHEDSLVAVDRTDGSSVSIDVRDGLPTQRKSIGVETPLEVSSDRKLAVVYNEDEHAILILDAQTGVTRSVLSLVPNRDLVSSKLSNDGSRIAIQMREDQSHYFDVWDVEKELTQWSWEHKNDSDPSSTAFDLQLMSWNHRGSQIAVVGKGDLGDDGSIYWRDHLHVFDVNQGKRVVKYLPAGGRVDITAIAWSSSLVALGMADGGLEVIDAASGDRRFSKNNHRGSITAIAWHPLDNRLAVASRDGEVKITTSKEGKVLVNFAPFQDPVATLAWSNDGQRLAAATSQGEIQTWDAGPAYELSSGNSRRSELAWAYYDRQQQASKENRAENLRAFIRYAPDTLGFWEARGNAYAELDDFRRAHEEFSKAVGPELQNSFWGAYSRACALLGSDRSDEYHHACAELVEAFQDSPISSNRGYVAWLASLTPNPHIDSSTIVKMARKSLEYGTDFFQLILCSALYRDGQYEEANGLLTKLADKLSSDGNWSTNYEAACAKYFLSMSRLSQGHEFQARRLLDEANELADAFLGRAPGKFWKRIAALQTLRQEATAEIAE